MKFVGKLQKLGDSEVESDENQKVLIEKLTERRRFSAKILEDIQSLLVIQNGTGLPGSHAAEDREDPAQPETNN